MAAWNATPSLDRFLGQSPELAALGAHAARLERLQVLYAASIPAYLAEGSSVANLKLETLVIHASNAAIATKLKQLVPRLKAEFGRNGFPLSDIQIRVRPLRPEPPPWKADREAHVSDEARHLLEDLGERLPRESPLAMALRRFVKTTG